MVKKFIFVGVLFCSIFSFLDVSAASLEERQKGSGGNSIFLLL